MKKLVIGITSKIIQRQQNSKTKDTWFPESRLMEYHYIIIFPRELIAGNWISDIHDQSAAEENPDRCVSDWLKAAER